LTADARAENELPPGRVLLADKPSGPTSHDIVGRARRDLGVKRVGHAGTLDPFATGLLIILIGREATREQARFMALRKTYVVEARFGARSSTGDRDGEITETGVVPPDPPALPTGEIAQRPPVYSAVKVGGVRAYKRARRGEEVEMPERLVAVHRFECLAWDPPCAKYEIECSSGTYVRSLIADLGDAYCVELRRTAIGPFDVSEAEIGEPLPLTDTLARLRRTDTS
jgi:tRNA pseudouridine55 synthase